MQAVYHMPTSEDDAPHTSIPLALQSLFYRLQVGEGPAPTKDLTRSFGWDTYDAFLQHDVQELNRVLCEKLEDKMKGTGVEGTIAKLFEGTTHCFVRGVAKKDVNSTRTESFMDLQLDVKGCKDVYASFDAYTAVETLEGANQYKSDEHGLIDAEKGVLFESLPPVLVLQLKRFEYDYARDAMVKINDKYEFPEELDLDAGGRRYLAAGADKGVTNAYTLHSVLVHSGGVHGGHYYAFARPDGSRWLRFDDERVTVEERARAMDDNYGAGGTHDAANDRGLAALAPGRCANAYMLVYVRTSDWPAIMCPVSLEADIPAHVRARLVREAAERERRRREKQEAHLFRTVRLARAADFERQAADRGRVFDLVDHDDVPCLRLRKAATLAEAREAAASTAPKDTGGAAAATAAGEGEGAGGGAGAAPTSASAVDLVALALASTPPLAGVPPSAQRWWLWHRRQNGTYRPSRALPPADDGTTLAALKDASRAGAGAGSGGSLDVWVETPPPGQAALPTLEGATLLFIKHFDPGAGTLRYAGHTLMPEGSTVADLGPIAAAAAGLDPASPVTLFEEVKFEPTVMVDVLEPSARLSADAQLEHGDIVVVQAGTLSPDEAGAAGERVDLGATLADAAPGAPPAGRFVTAKAFMTWAASRRVVQFKRLDGPREDGPGAAGGHGSGGGEGGGAAADPGSVTLELAREDSYGAVTAALAAALQRKAAAGPSPAAAPPPSRKGRGGGVDASGAATPPPPLPPPPPDGDHLRLTAHNPYTGAPKPAPMRHAGVGTLGDMLSPPGYGPPTAALGGGLATAPAGPDGVLWYETLDMPLPALEQLKPLRVEWLPAGGPAQTHTVRVPREATVADALVAVAAAVGGPAAGTALRLLEIFSHRVYKVFAPADRVADINDAYWTLRAEPVEGDEVEPLGDGGRLVMVCHFSVSGGGGGGAAATAAAATPPPPGASPPSPPPATAAALASGTVTTHGDPYFLRIDDGETLADIKPRLRARLRGAVPDAEWATWKFSTVAHLRPPEALADGDDVSARFGKQARGTVQGAEPIYLGLEHADRGPRRRAGAGLGGGLMERAVKIYA